MDLLYICGTYNLGFTAVVVEVHGSLLGCKFRRNSGGIPNYSGIFTNLDRNLITVHGGLL